MAKNTEPITEPVIEPTAETSAEPSWDSARDSLAGDMGTAEPPAEPPADTPAEPPADTPSEPAEGLLDGEQNPEQRWCNVVLGVLIPEVFGAATAVPDGTEGDAERWLPNLLGSGARQAGLYVAGQRAPRDWLLISAPPHPRSGKYRFGECDRWVTAL